MVRPNPKKLRLEFVFQAAAVLTVVVLVCIAKASSAEPEGQASVLAPEQRYLYVVIGYEVSRSGKIRHVAVDRVVDGGLNEAADIVSPEFLDRAVEFVSDGLLDAESDLLFKGKHQTWFVYDRENPISYSVPPSRKVLDAISERGRYIADYDTAAYIATDALFANVSNAFTEFMAADPPSTFVARKLKGRWQVAFGKLSKDTKTFSILAVARQRQHSNQYDVQVYDTPPIDRDEWRASAAAIKSAAKEVEPRATPYNPVLLKNGHNFIVYMLIGRTQPNVFPLGGDYRITVSGETLEVVRTERLHKSLIDMDIPDNTEATVSTAVLFDHPVETEVFFVRQWNKEPVPHYLMAGSYLYLLQTDGSIELRGFLYHRAYGLDWSDDVPQQFLADLKGDSE